MSDIITVRDIDTVTTEIKIIRRQAQQIMLQAAIEIGRRLAEAKEMLPHGEWGKWLAESVDYSQSTADNLLRIYKEYGDQQDSLFGNIANSESFEKLSYTQALALLAVPAEERAEFAEENNVAEMTTRELQQAIRERDQAQKQLREAESESARLTEKAEVATESEKNALELYHSEKDLREMAEEKVRKAASAQKKAEDKVGKLEKDLEKAAEEAKQAKELLAEAKEHPEIPESVMKQMQAEVAAQAAKEATEDLQNQLNEAKYAAASAEKSRLQAEAALAEAQKQAKLQSPEVAVFGSMFEDLQATMNRINGYRLKTLQTNPEAAAGMQRALQAIYTKALAEVKE